MSTNRWAYSRHNKMVMLMLLDAVLLPFALWCAVYLRLDGAWDSRLNASGWVCLVPALWVVPVFFRLGLYRVVIRFLNGQVAVIVFYGVTSALLVQATVLELARVVVFPRGALLIFWLFALAYVGGSRFLLRAVARGLCATRGARKRVGIYGAGHAGLQLMIGLQASDEYQVVALFDDNPELWQSTYGGVTVHAAARIGAVVAVRKIDEMLLAMPSVSRRRHREILLTLEGLHLPIRRLPPLADLVSGAARVDQLHEIELDDLLGRDPVAPKADLLARDIGARVVMVTGAGGSIGSELCRLIVGLAPSRIVLFELSEYALYSIDHELAQIAPRVPRVALLGSVLDYPRLSQVMTTFGVSTVYHAAAYKHVPLVEHNPVAAIQNNVFGTETCARAAEDCGVSTFVLISSDKAVRPTNVMGATKRLAELILQARAPRAVTRFVMVRFGNVLGSSGSVVPLFQRQIKHGGPVTVTHPEITRYFMTIPEAAQLVIQAGAMGHGGEVFVLDMGEPVKIADLARRIVHLSGFEVKSASHPCGDIEIRYDGLRPGEKLYEELLIGAKVQPTEHARIMCAVEYCLSRDELDGYLSELSLACQALDAAQAFALLQRVVREFKAASHTADWICCAQREPSPVQT